jgi:type IV pilus assembly protein PilW
MRAQIGFRRIRGFGLVEVLVAITIGLILLAGAISMLSTNKWTYRVVEHQSRIQENARFALETIARDLRMAGYFGCLDNLNKVNNLLNGTTAGSLLDSTVPVDGLENYDPLGATANKTWYPSGSIVMPPGILTGSDAIGIRYMDSTTAAGIVPPLMPTASSALHTNPGNGLAVGEIIAVTDCDNADIFQITGPSNPDATGTFNHNTGGGVLPGNASGDLSKTYEEDASIMRMASVTYYIGTGGDGRPALFRGVIPAAGDKSLMDARELIQGVEQMHILYGKDTTGDNVPDTYLKAGVVGLTTDINWDSVVNLRISIMVSSDEEVGQDVDNQARTLLDENVAAANDRRFRRVFTTTINMRNKASAS